ncbi:hypothetical protein BXA15_06360 [Campylobacter lari]|uniref:hypothetical protein n=1 Tax=Campylobacter TaxID=194 RepID=UPI0017ABFA3C|nr:MULTISPECIES: hypothetical protein [Campylobacter]EAI3897248.1 hypothetical protein [Campylobacter lari]EAJ5697089.1 hypothetical protein [Campylobacter lari]EHC7929211.1 hypothetical protein [Campylobacter lari]MCR2079420.1 hypothetical protein [Campylobacter lari subsp. concheus]MCV3442868.1 hypothetical protein [Campylobacter sp. IFREMER_LSEM_CL1097]
MNFEYKDTHNYQYNNHLEFANDLFKFAEECLQQNDNISFRMGIGRLYYAFYHKILHENIEELESKEETIHMHWHLFNNNGLSEFHKDKLLFLQRMRKWADYQTENSKKEVNVRHLIMTYQKMFKMSIKIKCK